MGRNNVTTTIEYRQVANSREAASTALEFVLQQSAAAIVERGRFVFALAGGSTPALLYQMLAVTEQDWSSWHLLYADERCLPRNDKERNSTMVEECWLDRVNFPPDNHHVPQVELGADAAAIDYGATVNRLLPIDLALLGMGEDGHTASLFPGHNHREQTVVPVHNSPKPPADRISMSYATLQNAASICFLVTGSAKQLPLERWLQGDDLPVARIHGREHTVLITDLAAPSHPR